MVEWIRLSDLMLSNDTGPMHVAAALGKPVVALFGPTEPRRTGPYGQLSGVIQISLPCLPCLKDYCVYPKPMECLRAISPDRVVAAVSRRLAVTSSSSSKWNPSRSPTPTPSQAS
jgi:ADP-heptose:LPS heptosyltransferase